MSAAAASAASSSASPHADSDDQPAYAGTTTAFVLSRKFLDHEEFVRLIRQRYAHGFKVVKVEDYAAETGDLLVDCYCSEFLTLTKLIRSAKTHHHVVLYVLGDWDLAPHEREGFEARGVLVMEQGECSLSEFVGSIM